MKVLLFVFALVTFPLWAPLWIQFWVIKKCWRGFAYLLLASLIGCAHTSSHLDKSPCACDFRPLNNGNLNLEKTNA